MSLTIAVTAGKTIARNELVNNAKLNALGLPTLAVSGTTSTAQIGDDTITPAKAAFGAWFYCTASGSNTITLDAAGHSITLVEGMIARFKVDITNTNAVDITFGGSTANLYRYYNSTTAVGVELAAGDLRSGQQVEIIYDGTQWQMLSPIGNNAVVVGTDAGSTDDYVITPSPSVRALADLTGTPVVFKANTINNTSGGGATLAVSGLTATGIRKSKDVALSAGDIKAGQWVTVTYDGTYFQLISPVTEANDRTTVSVRQTVLACSVDATTGLPNFLATGAVTSSVYLQNCAATPLVVTFAYGHDNNGAVDFVTRISTDGATWTGLGGTTTYYLYVDRNVSTGAITYGITTNRPTYINTSAVSAGAGFHTYLINTGFMYEGSATSTAIQRTFVGEATTSGGTVNSVTPYMPRGDFQSGSDQNLAAMSTNQTFTDTHQLGLKPKNFRYVLVCQIADLGYEVGDEVPVESLLEVTQARYRMPNTKANVTNCQWIYPGATSGTSGALVNRTTYSVSTGITIANWKVRAYASRGW